MKYTLNITDDYESYVTPKNRNKIHCGWRIRLKDIVVSDKKISPGMSVAEDKRRMLRMRTKDGGWMMNKMRIIEVDAQMMTRMMMLLDYSPTRMNRKL